jgi:hypothetical protein
MDYVNKVSKLKDLVKELNTVLGRKVELDHNCAIQLRWKDSGELVTRINTIDSLTSFVLGMLVVCKK